MACENIHNYCPRMFSIAMTVKNRRQVCGERSPYIFLTYLLSLFQGFYSCLAVGISLLFGSMFCKTWRVHQVFTTQNLQGAGAIQQWATTDTGLLTIVFCITSFDVILLTLWFTLDPIQVNSVYIGEKVDLASFF